MRKYECEDCGRELTHEELQKYPALAFGKHGADLYCDDCQE